MIACTSQGKSEDTGALDEPPLEAAPFEGGCEAWPPVVAGGVDGLPPVPTTVGARPPVAVGFEGTPDEPPVVVASPQLQVPTPEPVGLHSATPDFPSAQVQATCAFGEQGVLSPSSLTRPSVQPKATATTIAQETG